MKPLKFNPLLKSTIWGGDKIIPFKHLDITQENVGESWEISGVKGNETTVSEGELEGKSLNEVVELMKDELVGKENYTSGSATSSRCSSSSLTRVRTFPFRCILQTRLQKNRERNAERPKCGI